MNQISDHLEALTIRKLGMKWYRLFFGWLGTSIHELSHAGMCIIFRHRIDRIQLFNFKATEGRSGYVAHRYNPNSFYQKVGNFFIAVAPLLGGAVVIYIATLFLLPGLIDKSWTVSSEWNNIPSQIFNIIFGVLSAFLYISNFVSLKFYLFLYILFSVGSSMKLSPADLKNCWNGFWLLLVIFFIANLALNYFSLSSGIQIAIMNWAFSIYGLLFITIVLKLSLITLLSFLKK